MKHGISISAVATSGMVQLRYTLIEPAPLIDYAAVAASLEVLANAEPGISIQANEEGLSLFFATQDERSAEPVS